MEQCDDICKGNHDCYSCCIYASILICDSVSSVSEVFVRLGSSEVLKVRN